MFTKIHHILNEQKEKIEQPNIKLQIQNQFYPYKKEQFQLLEENTVKNQNKTITYIDAGSAILASGTNFSISFIRIVALTINKNPSAIKIFKQNTTVSSTKTSNHITYTREFFLLTLTKYKEDFFFENHLFEHKNTSKILTPPINIHHLNIKNTEESITEGIYAASPIKIVDLARRFAELQLIIDIQTHEKQQNSIISSLFVLDGTIDQTYPNENTYLEKLNNNTCALAKSTTFLTTASFPITQYLFQHGSIKPWIYQINQTIKFVKLHEKSNHVFRFCGTKEQAEQLLLDSKDAIFPGYPYGLIRVDQLARVTNEEKRILTTKLLHHKDAKLINNLLRTTNSHSILDSIR